MITVEFMSSFLYNAIRLSTPLIYAALACVFSHKVGLLNLAIESIMLCSALAGVLVSAYSESLVLGILAGLTIGILVGFIISFCVFSLNTDIFLSCIAINTAASGATVFIMYLFTTSRATTIGYLKSAVMPKVPIPLLDKIPLIGAVLSNHSVLTYLAFLLMYAVWFFIEKTPLGLRLRAVGENPQAAETLGIPVKKMYYLAFTLSSIMAAIGGLFMSMDYLAWFARDMISGRGFLGVAADQAANGSPIIAGIAALLYGLIEAFSNVMALTSMPTDLVAMLPYLLTILLIVAVTTGKEALKERKTKGKRAI